MSDTRHGLGLAGHIRPGAFHPIRQRERQSQAVIFVFVSSASLFLVRCQVSVDVNYPCATPTRRDTSCAEGTALCKPHRHRARDRWKYPERSGPCAALPAPPPIDGQSPCSCWATAAAMCKLLSSARHQPDKIKIWKACEVTPVTFPRFRSSPISNPLHPTPCILQLLTAHHADRLGRYPSARLKVSFS